MSSINDMGIKRLKQKIGFLENDGNVLAVRKYTIHTFFISNSFFNSDSMLLNFFMN